ncbi:MAG: AI-2E family transporter, partial [Bacteroidia bacterium]
MKWLYYIIPALFVLLFVWFFSDIIVYMIVAAIISFIGRPLMKLLQKAKIKKWQIPNALAALITLLSVYGFVVLVGMSLIPVVSEQARTIAQINPDEVIESFQEPIDKVQGWLEKNQIKIAGLTEEEIIPAISKPLPPVVLVQVPGDTLKPLADLDTNLVARPYRPAMSQLQKYMAAGDVPDEKQKKDGKKAAFQNLVGDRIIAIASSVRLSSLLNNVGSFIGNFFVAFFAVSFISFFFLKESQLIGQIIYTLTPKGYESRAESILEKLKPLLSRYFLGVLFEVLLVGGLLSLGLSIIGVPNALFIGFFAGMLNVIPYVGPIIGAVLGLFFATLASLEIGFSRELFFLLTKVATVFAIVQLIDNLVFQPLIYSSSVKAHPLEIFIVILMAGTLAGPLGMIAAIPVYTIFRAVAQEFLSEFKIVK